MKIINNTLDSIKAKNKVIEGLRDSEYSGLFSIVKKITKYLLEQGNYF
jgi:hypothetical protein